MTQSLFNVKFNYQSYNEKNGPIQKERELFLDTKNPIVNTYRLGGFESATISNVVTKLVRPKNPIEIDLDIERNEIDATICGETFLAATLSANEKLNNTAMNEDYIIDYLEDLNYKEVSNDNTYNRENDLDETYDFKVYDLEDAGSEWYYSDTAVVLIRKHVGLDVRCGYEYIGAFSGLSYDGLVYFLDTQIRYTVTDRDGNEVDEYEGSYQLTNDYKLVGMSDDRIELVKEGNTFFAEYYNPVYGV